MNAPDLARLAPANDAAAQAVANWEEALRLRDFLRDEAGGCDLHMALWQRFPAITRDAVFYAISLAWTRMWAVLALAKRELEIAQLELRAARDEIARLKGGGS